MNEVFESDAAALAALKSRLDEALNQTFVDVELTPGSCRAWIKSLRSGRYTQGTEMLVDQDDCYCCLGVLGDTVGDLDSARLGEGDELLLTQLLPYEAQDALSRANDEERLPFEDIAEAVEEVLLPWLEKQCN